MPIISVSLYEGKTESGLWIILETMDNNRCLVVAGPFLPYNDTVTQLVYKQLRLLPFSFDVCALGGPEDPTLRNALANDPTYQKFNVNITDLDRNVRFYIHNIDLFKALRHMNRYIENAVRMYQGQSFIYTNSFPCYSIRAGVAVKKINPDVRWIASFSDPLNHSPYKYDEATYQSYSLPEKIAFRLYCKYYVVDQDEADAFEQADLLVFIDEEQRDFMIEQSMKHFHNKAEAEIRRKCVIVPLNYVPEWNLIQPSMKDIPKHDTYILSHFGRVYGFRLIEEFLYAFADFRKKYPDHPVHINQYGEFRKSDKALIHSLGLDDCFTFTDKIPYENCIQKMSESDGVLLFDTILPEDTIQPYLPSKILEYSLLKKNCLAVTTSRSPAYRIMKKTNAIACRYDRNDILNGLEKLIIQKQSSVIEYADSNEKATEDFRSRVLSL